MPNGALKAWRDTGLRPKAAREKTDGVCCFCGTGCAIEVETEGQQDRCGRRFSEGAANARQSLHQRALGLDFVQNPDRLAEPLIRRGGKGAPLEEAIWDEAIAYVARRFNEIKAQHGPTKSLASLRRASAMRIITCSKARSCAIGTNNIDHCARLCHMASVVALKQSESDQAPRPLRWRTSGWPACCSRAGLNPTVSHPVISNAVLHASTRRRQDHRSPRSAPDRTR